MNFKYSTDKNLSYYAVDSHMNMTLTALVTFFQDIAIEHSDSAGYTIDKLLSNNLGWVITNYHIIAERWPAYGEKIKINTWSSSIKHYQAERCFEIIDENGNSIIRASSRWILMNLEKRGPEAIPKDLYDAYNTGTAPSIENEKYQMIRQRENLIKEDFIKVKRSHTDSNGHTNNTQYISWAMDNVPDEIYEECQCADFKIVYRKESTKGAEISIKTYENESEEGRLIITDFLQEEKVICTAQSIWK